MSEIDVTAIIPVFNDRAALEKAIPQSIEALSGISGRFELIVAEDGSTDASREFAERCEQQDHRIRLLHSDDRLGRGRALSRAIVEARGTIVCYYDVDLATDMRCLPDLIAAIRRGSDIATGSRLMPESNIRRTGGREIASRAYNFLVRLILGSTVFDHQCGFKSFDRQRILPVIPSIQSQHWFWDTELLVRCQRKGFRVKEFPVHWRASKGTTVKARDVVEMGSSILRLWWQLHVSEG
jgi:glycosyltransferase involved in cell wall biosynthesis